MTIVMISHNVSNLKIADTIYMMTSNGKITKKSFSDLN